MAAAAREGVSLLPGGGPVKIYGTSLRARLAFPARVVFVTLLWCLIFPPLVLVAVLRALYLRLKVGRPSQILRKGRYNAVHQQGLHYPCMQTYKEPLNEARLRSALVSLCAEDGIEGKDVDLKFHTEQPNDWPQTGSWDADHFIESIKRPGEKGRHFIDYDQEWKQRGDPPAKLRMHVWNGLPGKPTVVYFYGSMNGWDGSSNFNFVKELLNRYTGKSPNKVFQDPEMAQSSAAIVDKESFALFMLKAPFNIAKNLFMFFWGLVRSAQWAGGSGVSIKLAAINFTHEESKRFHAGCKQQGVAPFAAFSYAAVKGCTEVIGQRPLSITQQASLQDRHYCLDNQIGRDFVGDWLVGPVQKVPQQYGLKEAMAGYEELKMELDTLGPAVRDSFMAKAYGIMNSGSALFQLIPCYNTSRHCMDRAILMNNYGVRSMPPESSFVSWNWLAPTWFCLNTINVNGATSTTVGSSIWGLEAVEQIRDNIEGTLRKIMTDS